MKKTQTKVLNYRVLIDKEKYQNGSAVYVSHVPALGISDYGDSVEQTLKSTEKMIKFHVECLVQEGSTIPEPEDSNTFMVTTAQVKVSPKVKLSFA